MGWHRRNDIWDDFGDPLSFHQAPTTGQSFHDINGPQKMKHNDLSDPLTFSCTIMRLTGFE